MLFNNRAACNCEVSRGHGYFFLFVFYILIKTHVLKISRLAVDADVWW